MITTPQPVWAAQASLGEGALWSEREQALFWVDILGKRLHRYDPVRRVKDSWDFDEEISTVTERANGKGLVVALRRDLALFDTETCALVRLHRPEPDITTNRLNDGICDRNGTLWFGSMDFGCSAPNGAMYSFDGEKSIQKHFGPMTVPNGPTWSLDGQTIYFCDTVRGQVLVSQVGSNFEQLKAPRLWLQFAPDDGLPDGMTTDSLGRIWIAHWGGGCVTCHDPITAKELVRIDLPVSQVTNCAFGGADLRTLFITSACAGLTDTQIMREPLAGALFATWLSTPGCPAQKAAF